MLHSSRKSSLYYKASLWGTMTQFFLKNFLFFYIHPGQWLWVVKLPWYLEGHIRYVVSTSLSWNMRNGNLMLPFFIYDWCQKATCFVGIWHLPYMFNDALFSFPCRIFKYSCLSCLSPCCHCLWIYSEMGVSFVPPVLFFLIMCIWS